MSVFDKVRQGVLPAKLTVDEVYTMQAEGLIDEQERFELIDGEIVPMAAAKFSAHEWMKSRFAEALTLQKPKNVAVYVEPSITLDDRTFVEPDIALWMKGIESQDIRGPDLLLVVEIAVSSLPYDLREKAKLYAAHEVADYWVVDAIRRTVRIHRRPANGAYTEIDEWSEGEALVPLALPQIHMFLDEFE